MQRKKVFANNKNKKEGVINTFCIGDSMGIIA